VLFNLFCKKKKKQTNLQKKQTKNTLILLKSVMTSTLPTGTLGSVASLLAATLYQ
jgi:hypothetical protein